MAFLIDGKTFESLDVRAATLTRSASGEDSLVVVTARRLNTTPGFSAFEQITLSGTGADSGASFTGWLDRAPRRAEGGSQGWQYVFNGHMRKLARVTYREDLVWNGKDEEGALEVQSAGATGFTFLSRKVNPDNGEQQHKTLGEALDDLLDYAVAAAGGFTFDLPSGLDIEVPWEPRQDDQVLQALRALLKWSPELVCRWVGSELRIVRPSDTALSINPSTKPIRGLQIDPRNDLLCASAEITYVKKSAEGAVYQTQIDSHSGGEIPGGRNIKLTVYLEPGEPFPEEGIAEEFMKWAGTLHLEGQFTLDALDWSHLVGDRWSPVAAMGSLSAHSGICQTVVRDLFTRTQTITFGPPGHLGLLDLIALKRKPSRPDPGSEPAPPETGTLNITVIGLPEGTVGKWSVGDQGGEGDGTLTLPPGEYTVIFHPAVSDPPALYLADSVNVTVTLGSSADAEGDYALADLSPPQPWQLVGYRESDTPMLKVLPSTAFSDTLEIGGISAGSGGVVWVEINFDQSTGEVTSTAMQSGPSAPGSTDSVIVVPIGEWSVEAGNTVASNYRYGPLDGYACRNWYVDPVEYTLFLT